MEIETGKGESATKFEGWKLQEGKKNPGGKKKRQQIIDKRHRQFSRECQKPHLEKTRWSRKKSETGVTDKKEMGEETAACTDGPGRGIIPIAPKRQEDNGGWLQVPAVIHQQRRVCEKVLCLWEGERRGNWASQI